MDELILGNRIIHLTSLLLAGPVSRTESACALTDAIYAETLQHGERHLRAHWFKLLSWDGGGLMGNLPPGVDLGISSEGPHSSWSPRGYLHLPLFLNWDQHHRLC